MITVIVQFIIVTLSFASSMSIVDAADYLGLELNEENRVIVIIFASVASLVLICIKACIRFIDFKWKSALVWNPIQLDDQKKAVVASKQVFLGLTDTTFDIIAAIAILYDVDYSYQQSVMLLIGTFIGLSEEITELGIDLIITCCGSCNTASLSVFSALEYIGGMVEIGFGIYLATLVEKDKVFKMIAIVVMSILMTIMCCGCCLIANMMRKLNESEKYVKEQWSFAL